MTTETPTAMPDWLTRAEEQAADEREVAAGSRVLAARDEAEKINSTLAELGIVPLKAAHVVDVSGQPTPAVLVAADPEQGLHEVRAAWSHTSGQVQLLTADWEEGSREFGPVRLLHKLADVAEARRELPRFPSPHRNPRADAEHSLTVLNQDHVTADTTAVVQAINGLTAAVLYVAGLIEKP